MRVIVLSLSPFIPDPWTISAQRLFDLTGGNTGNMAFQFAVLQHIASEHRVMPISSKPEVLKAAGDIIVMPLANQLGSHTDLGDVADTLEATQLPVIGIGLGAQALDQRQDVKLTEGTERWIRVMASLSPTDGPNLGVRGEYTRQQLEKLGLGERAVVMGCPSNFIAPDLSFLDRIQKKLASPVNSVAVTAGIPHLPKLAKIEQDLADMVTVSHGLYIVQHGLEMVKLGRGEFETMTPDEFELSRAYIAPYMHGETFKVWCRNYARAFTDVRQWMDQLRQHDFVVGTRFHGAMLAIQSGTPAGCISHDSRVYEMCETMGIPVVKYQDLQGGITRSQLQKTFSFDRASYEQKRNSFREVYGKMLRDSGIATHRI